MTVFSKCFAAFLISSVVMLPALAQTPSTADPKAPDETAAKPTPPAQEPAAEMDRPGETVRCFSDCHFLIHATNPPRADMGT